MDTKDATIYDIVGARLHFVPTVKLVEPGISVKIVEDENGNPTIELVETPPRIVPSFDVKPID